MGILSHGVFDAIVAVFLFVIGVLVAILRSSISNLNERIHELQQAISKSNVEQAENYVKWNDLKEILREQKESFASVVERMNEMGKMLERTAFVVESMEKRDNLRVKNGTR